jgi:phytoene dehydrogenase-like protein
MLAPRGFQMRRCQPNVEDKEQLKQAVIAELDRIIANLRGKGDHYRASKVEHFKQEYFGEHPRPLQTMFLQDNRRL